MKGIKTVQLIDNLEQLATDIHDFILDDINQPFILRFLTGVDILPINKKISPLAMLKLIVEYFSLYSWEFNSVNMLVICELIKKLPQPRYHGLNLEQKNLNRDVMLRLKELFLLKANTTLKRNQNYSNQKLKQALIDSFLRKKFKLDDSKQP